MSNCFEACVVANHNTTYHRQMRLVEEVRRRDDTERIVQW